MFNSVILAIRAGYPCTLYNKAKKLFGASWVCIEGYQGDMTQLGLSLQGERLPMEMKAIVLLRAWKWDSPPMGNTWIVKKTLNNKSQIVIKSCYCIFCATESSKKSLHTNTETVWYGLAWQWNTSFWSLTHASLVKYRTGTLFCEHLLHTPVISSVQNL